MPACSQCRAPAVTFLRYSGRRLCREHFLDFFERRAKMQLSRQGRLPEGTLAVALSGGKDSVSVLHFLHGLTRDHPRIDLVAVTVDEGIAGYRSGSLEICRRLTSELGVPWRVVRTEDMAGYTIDAYAAGRAGPGDGRAEGAPASPIDAQGPPGLVPAEGAPASRPRPACGPCGVFRRLGVNRLAKEAGADAVVTGHNLDDTAQTVLMNVLKGDLERLARLAPHADPAEGLVPRLVPFRTIPEKEVLLYALLHGLPVHDEAECPYAARSQRFALRDMLLDLEARSPGTRHALVRMQDRLKPILMEHLPQPALAACPACGEPTSGKGCKACAWKTA